MNFNQAIQKLRDGKKVRRPSWQKDSYWVLSKDKDEAIIWNDTKPAVIHLKQIEAKDFEIYDEKNQKIEEIKSMVEAVNVLASELNIKKLDKEYSKKKAKSKEKK